MKRLLACVLVVSMAFGSVMMNGCTNIKDDRTRTQTEGTLVGAGAGAAVGAGIGALAGGGRGALIGALIGTVVGGVAGYGVGTHIANKKEEYASQEDWLDACLQDAHQKNEQLKQHNENLRAEIKRLDTQTAALQKSYAAKIATKRELQNENKIIEKKIKENNELLAQTDASISGHQQVLAEAKSSGKTDAVALLEAEIAALERNKKNLQEGNQQLLALSNRISV